MRSHIHRATARAGGFTFLISLAFAGNVPDEFRDLFIHLNTYMTGLHQDIDRRWGHTLHPGFVPMAGVLPANSNSGRDLLREGNLELTGLYISRLREMGCRGVHSTSSFPLVLYGRAYGRMITEGPDLDLSKSSKRKK